MAYTQEEIARKRKQIRQRETAQAARNRERTLLRSRPSERDLAELVATFERKEGFAR